MKIIKPYLKNMYYTDILPKKIPVMWDIRDRGG